MTFTEETFFKIKSECESNPSNTNLLKTFLNQMSEFKVRYDNSKGKTRGIKRLCKARDCYTSFYDFERNNKYCSEHSLTPYTTKFVKLNKKIYDLINLNLREKIFVNSIWHTENKIRWLYRYNNPNAVEFKKLNDLAIQKYFLEIKSLINKNIILCSVPSSQKGKLDTGVNRLIKLLTQNDRIDGINCLIRHTSRPKNSYGGDRSLQGQLNTLKSNNEEIIKNRTILLIDDVTKTGNSIKACSQILKNNGAHDVYMLAIWKAGVIND